MHISCGPSIGHNYNAVSPKAQNRSQALLEYKFALEESKADEEQKKDDHSGKLVTSREGGYIRQYLVKADGTRILISELQEDAESTPLTNHTSRLENHMHSDGIHQNTEEMISLLNFQAGIINNKKR
ncbi:hypothetical protein [Paenibacillus bouchesdurhonensis]|uniref:hypothetical protein n=1 Tax=Paenibacillus bouchesdurhonensis TaxID=1870990 RepID=UPI000DA63882|nr:hypothetical protein [Paenibacillus bouchesdurhonensis]